MIHHSVTKVRAGADYQAIRLLEHNCCHALVALATPWNSHSTLIDD